MKRINILCFLILGLITNFSAYAGVTDGGVTAYRWSLNLSVVIFTDDPNASPNTNSAPLGAAFKSATTCAPNVSSVSGLVCNGTSGEPVTDYTCDLTPTPNASNTTWCLFSENPRTGGKAWAVKYVNGDIPTNDGASIVRCKGTDVFHPDYGCGASLPSQISIEGGYIELDTTDGNAPFDGDCAETAHNGRMVVDDVTNLLYICTASGWKSTLLTD